MRRFRGLPLVLIAGWSLASCNTEPKVAGPVPEADQVIGADLKELYMDASAAAPHSQAQQQVILRMANKASNGKELLLVMRAAEGVFPEGSQAQPAEAQVRSIVTAKMMKVATLDQMTEYATHYPVSPESARSFVQRMFQLAGDNSEAQVWYRIRVAAFHLEVGDLEKVALARGNQLAGK